MVVKMIEQRMTDKRLTEIKEEAQLHRGSAYAFLAEEAVVEIERLRNALRYSEIRERLAQDRAALMDRMAWRLRAELDRLALWIAGDGIEPKPSGIRYGDTTGLPETADINRLIEWVRNEVERRNPLITVAPHEIVCPSHLEWKPGARLPDAAPLPPAAGSGSVADAGGPEVPAADGGDGLDGADAAVGANEASGKRQRKNEQEQ